jgi:hypothetical protein
MSCQEVIAREGRCASRLETDACEALVASSSRPLPQLSKSRVMQQRTALLHEASTHFCSQQTPSRSCQSRQDCITRRPAKPAAPRTDHHAANKTRSSPFPSPSFLLLTNFVKPPRLSHPQPPLHRSTAHLTGQRTCTHRPANTSVMGPGGPACRRETLKDVGAYGP